MVSGDHGQDPWGLKKGRFLNLGNNETSSITPRNLRVL